MFSEPIIRGSDAWLVVLSRKKFKTLPLGRLIRAANADGFLSVVGHVSGEISFLKSQYTTVQLQVLSV